MEDVRYVEEERQQSEGDSQESVVSLFKQHGGKYFPDSIGYTQGNVMYCPIHKALYQRSKFENFVDS